MQQVYTRVREGSLVDNGWLLYSRCHSSARLGCIRVLALTCRHTCACEQVYQARTLTAALAVSGAKTNAAFMMRRPEGPLACLPAPDCAFRHSHMTAVGGLRTLLLNMGPYRCYGHMCVVQLWAQGQHTTIMRPAGRATPGQRAGISRPVYHTN